MQRVRGRNQKTTRFLAQIPRKIVGRSVEIGAQEKGGRTNRFHLKYTDLEMLMSHNGNVQNNSWKRSPRIRKRGRGWNSELDTVFISRRVGKIA